MHQNFWQERWARNEIGFHLEDVHPGLRRHWPRLALPEDAAVLVPLCGKSLTRLARRAGPSRTGVELSQKAVEAFFAEQGLEAEISQVGAFKVYRSGRLEIRCGDFFALAAQDVADCRGVYDRAALIALPPAMRQRYAALLTNILPAGCQQLLVTLDYDRAEMDGPPFAVSRAEVSTLYDGAWDVQQLEAKEVLERNPKMRERGLQRLQEQFTGCNGGIDRRCRSLCSAVRLESADKGVGLIDGALHVRHQLVDIALQRAVLAMQGADRAGIEVVLEKQHLIAQYAEHRLDALFGCLHALQQRPVFGAGTAQLLRAGSLQAGIAVLLQFALPFLKSALATSSTASMRARTSRRWRRSPRTVGSVRHSASPCRRL